MLSVEIGWIKHIAIWALWVNTRTSKYYAQPLQKNVKFVMLRNIICKPFAVYWNLFSKKFYVWLSCEKSKLIKFAKRNYQICSLLTADKTIILTVLKLNILLHLFWHTFRCQCLFMPWDKITGHFVVIWSLGVKSDEILSWSDTFLMFSIWRRCPKKFYFITKQ